MDGWKMAILRSGEVGTGLVRRDRDTDFDVTRQMPKTPEQLHPKENLAYLFIYFVGSMNVTSALLNSIAVIFMRQCFANSQKFTSTVFVMLMHELLCPLVHIILIVKQGQVEWSLV